MQPSQRTRWLFPLPGLIAILLLPAPAGLTHHHPVHAHAPVEILATGLQEPTGLAWDPATGDLFIAEADTGVILRLDAQGGLHTHATGFQRPRGIARDPRDGALLVADERAGTLTRIAPNGIVTLVRDDLRHPHGVTVAEDGTLYVTAAEGAGFPLPHREEGVLLALAPDGSNPQLLAKGLVRPAGLRVLPDGRIRFVADRLRNEPEREGGTVFEVTPGEAPAVLLRAGFTRPQDLALDALEATYLSAEAQREEWGWGDRHPGRGVIGKAFGEESVARFATGLQEPRGLAFDGAGNLYVAEADPGRILRFRAPRPPALTTQPPAVTTEATLPLTGTAEPNALLTLRGATVPLPPQADVSAQVRVRVSSKRWQPRTGLFVETLALTSTGATPLAAPLAVVVTSIANPGVTLRNATTTVNGSPAVDLPLVAGLLRPGETARVTLIFQGLKHHQPLTYTWELWALRPLAVSDAQGRFSFPVTLTPNTENHLEVYAMAAFGLGLTSAPLPLTVTHDDQPPETTITTSPPPEIGGAEALVTFTGVDNLTPLEALQYAWRLDGGPWSAFASATTAQLTGLLPGPHLFEVTARDLAGNEDASPAQHLFTVIPPPTLAALTPEALTLRPGESGAFTATISPAQPTETMIRLTSSDPTVATVPPSATVAAGSVSFSVPVAAGSPGTATITASLNGSSLQRTVTVLPSGPALVGLTPVALQVAPGASAGFTLTLSAPAPTGTIVTVSSSDPAVVAVPAGGTVTIPAGHISQSVSVAGVALGQAVITATLNGSTVQGQVTITAAAPTVVSLQPTVLGLAMGSTGTLTLTLNAAQATDTVVPLATSNPDEIGLPGAQITIPANTLTATFPVVGGFPRVGTVTAALNGSEAVAAVWVASTLPAIRTLTCPPAVAVGAASQCTVHLNAIHAADLDLPLAATDPTVLEAPATVRVPANTGMATFPVTGLAAGSAEVVAGPLTESTQRAMIAVVSPSPGIAALGPNPVALAPGATTTLTVTLTAAQPTATVIPVSVTAGGVAQARSSVTVPAGSLTAPLPLTGLAVGSTTLTVGPLNGTQAQVEVTVTDASPTVAGLTPDPASLFVYWATPLRVRLSAAQPAPTLIPLATSDPSTVQVPATVAVPAGALEAAFPTQTYDAGTAVLTAGPLNGATAQATVTVAGEQRTFTIVPASATIATGETQQFTALAASSSGLVQDDTPWSSWQSSNSAIAKVAAKGQVTALAPGVVTITAKSEGGGTATATLTVTLPPGANLAIAPTSPTLFLGAQLQFQAMATFTDGSTQDLTAGVAWTSGNPTVATITSPGGLATGLAPGSTTITARVGDVVAGTTLTVIRPVLSGLMLIPLTPTRAVEEQVQFQATGTYTDGTTQDLTAAVTWTSSNPTVAPITSPGGLATALAEGTTAITATHPEGLTASTTLTVRTLSPPSLAITEPGEGATLNTDRVLVRGTVTGMTAEIGVVVNGAPAAVYGTDWAVEVPLEAGTVVLTATATDSLGATTSTGITLSVPTNPSAPVSLEGFPRGGAAPLGVTWRVHNNTARALVQFEFDETGDGPFGPPTPTFDGVTTTYTGQGLHVPTLRVTDDQGQVYIASTVISVGAAPPLEPKWEGLKDALRRADLPAALSFIHSDTRAGYEATFRRLSPAQLAIIDQYLTSIFPVDIGPTGAEYEMRRLRDGQTFSYAVWFQVDADGIWRLRMF